MEISNEDDESTYPVEVHAVLVEAKLSCSFRVLGSQLGLDPPDLDEIESYPYNERLIKLLIKCSQRRVSGLSWKWVAEVLKKPALRQYNVAAYIEGERARRSSASSDLRELSLSSSISSTEPFSPTSSASLEHIIEFSIPNVVNHLRVIQGLDWDELGIRLGLSPIDMQDIKQQRYQWRIDYLQRLVELLFVRDPDCNWEKLRQAIYQASNRRESLDSLVESSAPSTPTSPTGLGIESQLIRFNQRFATLQTAARRQLELKVNAVELIEDELDTLPPRILKENHAYIRRVANKTTKFTNVKDFFRHLHLHCWNFFEYKVLEVLINNNCSEELQERMAEYKRDLHTLKENTKIAEFFKCETALDIIVKKANVPETFKKLTTKHGINANTHTLLELDNFRRRAAKEICLRRTLLECAFQLYSITPGSIVVEWLFPEEYTDFVVEFFYSDEGVALLRIHIIEKLLIDGETIPTLLLQGALNREDLDAIKSLLQDKAADIDINSRDKKSGQTALIYVAKSGHLETVELLLERGADLHITDKLQRSALIFASHEGHTDVVKVLLEKGAQPNQRATKGWTSLMLASYRGHVEVVELLLRYGSDVNQTNEDGQTALQRLCLYNKTRYPSARYEPSERRGEVAKVLLEHGTDIRILDNDRRTPLIAASDSGFSDIVKMLIDKIRDLPDNKRQKYLDHKNGYSWTALMAASEKGHAEVVGILIEAGASPSITKDKDDVSALHIAVEHGHTEVVEELVLFHKMDKSDLNARDNYGMTPLILATKNRNEQIINVLIHAGVDVDAKAEDEDQMTALMFAVKVGSFDVVKMLVEHSANIFAMDSKKQTVLEMAKHSSKEIHDYLSEKCKEAEELKSRTAKSH